MHTYLFVLARAGENVAQYVEGWFDPITSTAGERYDASIWKSKRSDSDARMDAEIAVGRLSSGLIGARAVCDDDPTVDLFREFDRLHELVRS